MRIGRNAVLCSSLSLAATGLFIAQGQTAENSPRSGLPVVQAVEDAQSVPSRIIDRIDDMRLARLHGNTHPKARAEFDEGLVYGQLPMERMILVLKRSPEQEAALEAFMARQLDPTSADFHHWLGPKEFGRIYGPSENDLSAVSNWLQNHGFSIDEVSNGRTFIEFSGTARLVEDAFHTKIHRYRVNGEEHIGNNSDPSIPEALGPVVAGVLSLHNFFSKPLHRNLGSFHRAGKTGGWEPDDSAILLKPTFGVNYGGATFELVSPYDFATIYNVLPLWNAGIDGTGQTIAIAGRSDISLSDVAAFRSSFGLPAFAPTVIVNGTDPGVPSLDDKLENTLDVEWSGAVAKGATIKFVTTASTMNTDGAVASAMYIIDNNVAPIMSFSYGDCELDQGTAGNAFFNSMWQQGAALGITEFVASGDQGSAACDVGHPSPYLPQLGLAVSGPSSTPWDVAVGGTDFQWPNLTTGPYWSSGNSANFSSALSYIPEVPWNGTCASDDVRQALGFTAQGYTAESLCNELWSIHLLGFDLDAQLLNATGGTGGASALYTKPAWQTGTGVPADGKRDVPDVSLFASAGELNSAYVVCDSDLGPCTFSNSADAIGQGVGGTSVASPAMAGIMAMVLQKIGGAAQGLANPAFYQLASQENLSSCNTSTVTNGNSCFFYDITTDNIRVPCATGSLNCITGTPGDAVGILSGHDATTGYDLATGLGSVNVTNLVNAWVTTATPVLAVLTSPTPGTQLPGSSATFTWTAGTGVSSYGLWLGTSVGTFNLYNSGPTGLLTATATGLPTNGATIYARMFSMINGVWQSKDYTYTESGTPTLAVLTSPTPGTQLGGSSVTFTWTAGAGVSSYGLWLGTSVGAFNLYNSGPTALLTATATGLPTNGATIYARMFSMINGVWQSKDYTYTESGTPVLAVLTSPTPGTQLGGSSVTFTWTAGAGVSSYGLWLGTSVGTFNLYNSTPTTALTATATGLPTNGATIYARMFSMINGVWQSKDYTYTAHGTPVLAVLTSPTPGTQLGGSSVTFTWTAGAGVSSYGLWLGTSVGTFNLYNSTPTTALTATATGLPTNGATIYARMFSMINGVWQSKDYTYTESGTP